MDSVSDSGPVLSPYGILAASWQEGRRQRCNTIHGDLDFGILQ
tara:strand:+ start:231 stop:359 length:129 start_codon:yes stop_codon:yes gene_type:complete